jgi:hypothetical protein
MTVTTNGLSAIAAIIGASGLSVPTHFAIGSGNTAANIADTTLENEWDRNAVTSRDLTIAKSVTWIGDFSSVEVSGLALTEFGLLNSAAGGNLFHRDVIGSIQFDGEVELQLQTTFRFV